MDRNNSLERRYSFNTAQNNHVAESTHLNGSSFCWGSSSLSPKHRSNSIICLNNTHNDSSSIVTSPKSKNVTKIDARIVADVQSKGLASRIVKYHENGTRLNRSMSAHNLYSKPGQFPVVTLKKTELPYRATKQNLSMTRIAPPEKSMFYGNTLSSLLRSNSVVGLQKSNEDISRENRPILHPPPTENDMAPTRSVLDVLKEISRKRINSDDLDTAEASKKYCNRAAGGNDLVDTGINSTFPNLSSHIIASGKSFKRQRDFNASHQSTPIQETRTSPEQAKKRLCNYNNDITSSLSSSIKCKSYEKKRPSYNLNQTMPTNLESYETQKAKIQRYHEHNNIQADLGFDNLANNLKNVDNLKPVTPIPATPCTQDQSGNGVAPSRTVSEPLYKLDNRKSTLNSVHPANKPRLTLFNKNYDVSAEKLDCDSSTEKEDDLYDSGECVGIQFVKPKKLSSIKGSKNPVLERTQKSKLALMLSGLRGELYQTADADELDSSKNQEKTKFFENNNFSNIPTTTSASKSSSTTTTTLTTVISSSTVTPNTTSSTSSSTTITANTPTKLVSSVEPAKSITNTGSPLVGIKLTPQKSTIICDATKNTETPAKPNAPVLGGFSFGTNNTLTCSFATPTTNTTPKSVDVTTTAATSEDVGLVKSTPSTPSIITNTAPAINFNMTSAKKSEPVAPVSVTPTSFLIATSTPSVNLNFTTNSSTTSKPTATFSFGTPPLATTVASVVPTQIGVVGTSNSVTTPNVAFNFGISAAKSTTANTVAATPSTIFGSSPVTAASTTTTNSTTSNTKSFGSNLVPTTMSAAPIFGASSVTTKNNLTSTSFSFGTPSNQPAGITNAFGTASNQPAGITNSSSGISSGGFSFGSNSPALGSLFAPNSSTAIKSDTPISTTVPAFSFGSASGGSNPVQSSAVNNSASSIFPSNSNKDNIPNVNAVAPSVFGTPQPSFGTSSTSGSVFGAPAVNSAKHVFGSSLNASSTSVFGSSNTTFGSSVDNKSSVFGGDNANSNATPAFSFGSNATEKSTSNNPSSTTSGGFSFGSAANTSASGSFAFGGTSSGSSTTNPANIAPNNSFAMPSSVPNKTFAFGSSNNKSENNSTNLFSESMNKQSETAASPGGFSFGSAIAAKPSTSSTFSFGSSSNSDNIPSNNAPSTGFAFGAGAASKTNETPVNKPFSFGTASSIPQTLGVPHNNSNSSNIFGSAPAGKTAPPPFNFGASTNLQSNTAPANNIFAPPPSNMAAGPGDRPIRRATRRLQK